MRALFSLTFLCLCTGVFAQTLSGTATDDKGQALPFSTILVKGTPRGLTTDEKGRFSLHVTPGPITLLCEHVGYAKSEKTVNIVGDDTIHFVLHPQELHLNEILIQAREDPAYGIIRHAIRTREAHLKELGAFRCQVYTKGVIRIYGYPKKFLGTTIDSSNSGMGKNGILYLSETEADYAASPPDKEKVEVLSSRVSGDSSAYGLSFPFFITFYRNILPMGGLNPRGFISPIADGALHYYKFKLVGIFYEDGRRVDRIRVTPRRSFEPCFAGYISIIHDEWRIHSTDLYLVRDAQMQYLDSLTIQQLYAPVTTDTNVWAIRSQVIIPYIRIIGFKGGGNFVSVYSDYDLHPAFPKGFFDRIIIKYDTGSNNRPRGYWDTIRPVPLSSQEVEDYAEKDSIERVHNSQHYRDSVANAQKGLLGEFLADLNPSDVEKHAGKYTIFYSPILGALGFNTVEGYEDEQRLGLKKQMTPTRSYTAFVQARYGLESGLFSLKAAGNYLFSSKTKSALSLSGGQYVFQYDQSDPINNLVNTYYTLLDRENYMKLYRASFGKLGYTRDLMPGLKLTIGGDFEDRSALENRDTSVWVRGHTPYFSPNYPVAIMDSAMPSNKAASVTFTISYHPGTRYIEFPEGFVPVQSSAPTLNFSYTKGIPGVFGSASNYDKWTFSASGDVDARIAGRLSFYGSVGGFLTHAHVDVPDYLHFNGNETFALSPGPERFQVIPYYLLSNTDPFFAYASLEHHFNGLLTNKIPLFRRLNWYLVGGVRGLYLSDGSTYLETSVGLENIFKFLRFDYFWGFPSGFPAQSPANPISPAPGAVFTGLRVSSSFGRMSQD